MFRGASCEGRCGPAEDAHRFSMLQTRDFGTGGKRSVTRGADVASAALARFTGVKGVTGSLVTHGLDAQVHNVSNISTFLMDTASGILYLGACDAILAVDTNNIKKTMKNPKKVSGPRCSVSQS
ncbi:hypothetical protein Z043_113547 [Scleropages formosus]|uniref:Uncharacterized protein n=1 Tax=Scleropages formosus TaxID=113540 RepID=A0A0P7YJV4_SCLFO|nr:hypothetical protein Z043_113547 [Scleropages formosus]